MKITSTIVQYRVFGCDRLHATSVRRELTAFAALVHVARKEGMDTAEVDILSIKYIYATQHGWAKVPA